MINDRRRLPAYLGRLLPWVAAVVLAAGSGLVTWRALALRDTRAAAHGCAANLRKLSTALNVYTEDHDGMLPALVASGFGAEGTRTTQTWLTALRPYVGQLATGIACPSRHVAGRLRYDPGHPNCSGYAMNGYLARERSQNGRRWYAGALRSSVTNPALLVTLFDARPGIISLRSPDLARDSVNGIYLYEFESDILAEEPGATRHGGGANYSFLDGHVRWLRPGEFSSGHAGNGQGPGFRL